MIEFHLLNDKEKEKLICEKEKIEYNESILIFKAEEKNEIIGYSTFNSKTGEIYNAVSEIIQIINPLLKACMNYLDLHGIEKAFCGNMDLEPELKKCLFKLNNGIYEVNLTGYFDAKH